MIVLPEVNNVSISHAVNICDGNIFDSTQIYSARITKHILHFISGYGG